MHKNMVQFGQCLKSHFRFRDSASQGGEHLYREELDTMEEFVAVGVELGEVGHEALQLVHDVLHVLVVQQLQLGEHVGATGGKPLPGLGPASQD